MRKQEQIEEMVKTVVDREKNYVIGETECKKCNLNKCDLHCNIHSEISYDCETLYNAGYRKIPEDSVVLSREEWKQIKNSLYYSKEELEKKLQRERKETAKEIAEKLKIKAIRLSEIENYHVCNLIDELLKEYEK